MRRLLVLLSLVAAMVFGLVAVSDLASTAQEGTPVADDQGIAGSWVVTIEVEAAPSFTVLQSFEPGGTVVGGGLPAFRGDPTAPVETLYTSVGVGVWENTGPDTYAVTLVLLYGDVDGNLLATETVREDVTLDESGDSFSGTSTFIGNDQAGNMLYGGVANTSGTRITMQESGTPVAMPGISGTPVAATPTS